MRPGTGLRHAVAIPGIGHCYDPPPQSSRDRPKRIRLRGALEEVFKAGRGEEDDDKAEQHRKKRLTGVADRPPQTDKTRCIADEFEHPDQTEQDRIPGFEDEVEHTRQRAEYIEDPTRGDAPGQPSAPAAAILGSRSCRTRAGYQAQQ